MKHDDYIISYFTCPVCRQKYEVKHHSYPYVRLRGYEMFVCQTCYRNNHDGWARTEAILKHCEENNIKLPFPHGEKDIIPREF